MKDIDSLEADDINKKINEMEDAEGETVRNEKLRSVHAELKRPEDFEAFCKQYYNRQLVLLR